MIYLTSCYGTSANPGPARAAEFRECLRRNLACSHIAKAVVLADKSPNWVDPDPRVRVIAMAAPPQYNDLVSVANLDHKGEVCIIANPDLYFDETLGLLDGINWDNLLICLSHTESNGKAPFWNHPHPETFGEAKYHWPNNSQGAWMFKAPLPDFRPPWRMSMDFPMGVPGCDNRIAYEAGMSKIRTRNPWPEVRAWHMHTPGAGGRARGVETLKGASDVPPCRLSEIA
jgi:hypothetical protein